MSTLGILSGGARGFRDVVLPELLRRKRQKQADEDKEKRNQDIVKAWNTLNNQNQPMPQGDYLPDVTNWAEGQKAQEAEMTLLRNDVPASAVMGFRKDAEKKKKFDETMNKLPEDFKKQIEPVASLIEDDPDALLKLYGEYTKATGKADPESLALLGLTPAQFEAIGKAKTLGGETAAAWAAKKMGINWDKESGEDAPVWRQKQEYIDNLTIKDGKLIPWDKLDDVSRRQLATVGVDEDNYTGAAKIKGMKVSDFKSISGEIAKPFVGFEAMLTPQGKSFQRWSTGEKAKTAEQREMDSMTFPYFEKTFTKKGTVKDEAVKRRYDTIQGVVDLADLRPEVQDLYTQYKAANAGAPDAEADWESAQQAGDDSIKDEEWKALIARLKKDE